MLLYILKFMFFLCAKSPLAVIVCVEYFSSMIYYFSFENFRSNSEFLMTSIFKLRRISGTGGGKDPNRNKEILLGSFNSCKSKYYSAVFSPTKKIDVPVIDKLVKVAEGSVNVDKKSAGHFPCISVKNNVISQTNLTHSNVVNGHLTMPVGKDLIGRNSYAVARIVRVDTNKINDNPGLDLLKNYYSILLKKCEVYPVQNMELMNQRIGFVARYHNVEWDETIETKEEILNKLETLIKEVEERINNNVKKNN